MMIVDWLCSFHVVDDEISNAMIQKFQLLYATRIRYDFSLLILKWICELWIENGIKVHNQSFLWIYAKNVTS